ncbi:alkaline phosphatase D family protein [Rhodopirellula sp. MGV]|uniref:alkaline phosphatase D family protein n=1 Tax=Rhodopirellula sp. MGV TaxID=2023130 RepID=UPI000B969E61|nr:alkaline phosphatase D family protein [Rhodopirellula sp. MGV]OYP28380.1 twin-arginine translocation pathway signal [Rhodopirellula sp. MGV]PNY38744.1 twin-arginine translocation pathway signal [Rhodopirellula baltica]
MTKHVPRRSALKTLGASSALLGLADSTAAQEPAAANSSAIATTDQPVVNWADTHDRVWLAGNCWANPMEDWVIRDGAAECTSAGGDRNVHLITHQLTDPTKPFHTSVIISQVELAGNDDGVGFRLGVQSDLNEHRSNVFAKNGIKAGLQDGELFIKNKRVVVEGTKSPQDIRLQLVGEPAGDEVKLSLTAFKSTQDNAADTELGHVSINVAKDGVLGNIAIANSFDPQFRNQQGARYRFRDWQVGGEAFSVDPDRTFGPILWTMYSLSDTRTDEGFVLKLSALTGPLGEADNKDLELQFQDGSDWTTAGTATLDTDAWTATFRIANWDASKSVTYRVVYREKHPSGKETESTWSGTIRPNPTGRPLRMGALTCQNDYAFPYEPVAENVVKLDPDLLYFSGDQLYENHGGYGIIRRPADRAILNYLRKYYQFGWSFRHAMKDRPTICLPDDHDVFQGNVWGEGGAPMDVESGGASSNGGYIEPARMVNVVHKTNCAHHPDAYDPTPCKQDISVYYGDMVYGDVGFAIIADRQWKSGPQRVDTGSGRADHLADPDIDPLKLDKPGLELLGERQHLFLKDWAADWRGHSIKVLLSQTVFGGVATHHGGYNGYLVADLDCGGWPQTQRDNAIRIAANAKPLHINGDQHLTSLVQYGVDKQRDSFWSFCTPAIAVGYPRWWRADEVGMPHENRPKHGMENTGEYLDGLGNKIYVYSVGNPIVPTAKNRYEKAHQKASGFGYVVIDPKERTYTINSFRFLVDVTDGNPENQFPNWPVTIHQDENGGANRIS